MNNKIQIDGEKLKTLLESVTGKSLVEIALENGFSKDFFRNVIRRGEASPNVQAVVRLYGIEPSAYEKKADIKITCEPKTDAKQLSIDDLITEDARDVLKAVIKEAIVETLNSIVCNEVAAFYDSKTQVYTVALNVKKEAIQCKRA
jgi:hypothetical protein